MIKIVRVSSDQQYAAVLSIREEVFVNEQGVPRDIEQDELDKCAVHVLALNDECAVGCGRIVFMDGYAKLGRIAVRKHMRHRGVGRRICEELINIARERNVKSLVLHAQISATEFYKTLGFKTAGAVFQEAGMDHVRMELDLLN